MAIPNVRGKRSSKAKIGKFKVKATKYTTKELKERFSRQGQGQVIYLKDGEDVKVRFLEEPEDWVVYTEHRINKGGRWDNVPCVGDGCPQDDDEDVQTREVALIQVYDVKQKKIRLFKAGPKVATDIIAIASRGKLLNRDYNIIREGSDLETRYIFDAEDRSERKVKDKLLDVKEILRSWVDRFYGGASSKKKSKIRDDDEDEDDDEDDEDTDDEDEDEDDEDEDEDEEEEKPKKKKKGKSKKDDDEEEDDEDEDDEDEDEEEDDEDESDDEDDEEAEDDEEEDDEDEEEEDEKPRKKPKGLKSKKKKGKKK